MLLAQHIVERKRIRREARQYLLDGADLLLALQWLLAEFALFEVIAYLYAGLKLGAVQGDELSGYLLPHTTNEDVLESLKAPLHLVREVVEFR